MAEPHHHPYLKLKLAHELYRKPPERLDAEELKRVDSVAERQLRIERGILATPDAARVLLPASSVDQAVAEIRDRYATHADFVADLDKVGLDPDSLRAAIASDLKVEAVLERVASREKAVSDTDVEIFYLMHRERFTRPERRTLRHILVTINADMPGNDRATARARLAEIRARMLKSPECFAAQALKHSECPTATNGGLLGAVARGQLFAELEPVAFALAPGALSEIVESPLGFHLLLCESIEAETTLTLASVHEKVRAHLEDARRRAAQKAWIAGLFKPRD